jgi:hypothetical protein
MPDPVDATHELPRGTPARLPTRELQPLLSTSAGSASASVSLEHSAVTELALESSAVTEVQLEASSA